MGNLWMEKGDIPRAEACYRSAFALSIAANPERGHDGALTNLGIIATRREAWAEAERYFSESLRFDPADAKTWFFLAESRSKLGNRTGALEAIEKAHAIRPGHPEIESLRAALQAP